MSESTQFLIAIGMILLVAIAADWIGRYSFVPRVTLLMIFGIISGPQVLGLIPGVVTGQFEFIANIALLMVGFLIGGKLSRASLDNNIARVFLVALIAVATTFSVVSIGLLGIGVSLTLALLLGCIATATAPAATIDVITELEFKGPFASLLSAIVAIDDAIGLILFSIVVALLGAIAGGENSLFPLIEATREVGGAILLGLLIGLPGAYLTGRLRPGQPILVEAMALVFLCGGIALWLQVSHLIASIVMGATIANLAKHHDYPFHAIEGIEWLFLIIFFTLAGASLSFETLGQIGAITIAYITLRVLGKLLGGLLGAKAGKTSRVTQRWLGMAMMPQAGVAVGMALAASVAFPQHRQTLLSIVISTTIFFELIGPIFTRLALRRTSQAGN